MGLLSWLALCGLVASAVKANISSRGPNLFGYLSPDEEIGVFEVESSCYCRQLCFTRPACASVSFSPKTDSCHLYRRVASHLTLLPDPDREYHFIRRRSEHHEFCAANSDCLQDGDRCLGFICLAEEHLTCLTLKNVHGVNESGTHWGAVSGLTVPLYCDMTYQSGGWTLLAAGGGAIWNATSALWRPAEDDSPALGKPYSIYQYADAIARSPLDSTDDFFEIDVYDVPTVGGGTWRVPRTESLLRSEPGSYSLTLQNGRQYGAWKLSKTPPVVPWLASARELDTFISLNPVPDKLPRDGVMIGAKPGKQRWGGLINSGYVAILIRE